MPIYEYRCLECSAEFEALVMKADEASDLKCPSCKSRKLEDKISAFASCSNSGSSYSASCDSSSG